MASSSLPSAGDSVLAAARPATVDPDRAIRIWRHNHYPIQVWWAVAAFIGLVTLQNIIAIILRSTHKLGPSRPRTAAISLRRLPVAIVHAFRVVAFRVTVPIGGGRYLNTAEIVLTAMYASMLTIWALINTTSVRGRRFDPNYYAHRSGLIATGQFALVALLGVKNNLLSFLTGISFDRLLYLHRATARMLCVLVWLHAAGRFDIGIPWWHEAWMQLGVVALVPYTLLAIVSLYPLRKYSYEIFKGMHLVSILLLVLAGYFHVDGLLKKKDWMIPTIFIWGLDRFIRLVRMIVFNWRSYVPWKTSAGPEGTQASIDVLSPHFVRVTVPRPPLFRWAAGQAAYLSVPSLSGTEQHPFTICNIDASLASSSEKKSSSSLSNDKLVFLVTVRDGFTKRLFNAAATPKANNMKVILDGPYSRPPPMVGYDTVILIAGGSGVAFTLPILLDLIHRAREGKPTCKRIVFLWAMRERAHAAWVSDVLAEVLQDIPASITLSVRFSITRAEISSSNTSIVDTPTTEKDSELYDIERGSNDSQSIFSSSLVEVQQGRPDIDALIASEIQVATGDISVNVCGTYALTAAVRSSLRRPRFGDILRGGPSIRLHVEES